MKTNFTQVQNEILDNKDLTLQEKGLLCILLRNKEQWKINEKEITARSVNGRDATHTSFSSLEKKGYIERVEKEGRDKNGKFTKQRFKEVPEGTWKLTEKLVNKNATTPVKPSSPLESRNGEPVTENPQRETRNGEPAPNNTNSNNTKQNNTKEIIQSRSSSCRTHEEQVQDYVSASAPAKKFFFEKFEQPSLERLVQFAKKNDYPVGLAPIVHQDLLRKDYKDNKGNLIQYWDRYITNMFQTKKETAPATALEPSIDENYHPDESAKEREERRRNKFIQSVTDFNNQYVSLHINSTGKDEYRDNWRMKMKESAEMYFNKISHSQDKYREYVREFYSTKENKSPSSFLKYVRNHEVRVTSKPGLSYGYPATQQAGDGR